MGESANTGALLCEALARGAGGDVVLTVHEGSIINTFMRFLNTDAHGLDGFTRILCYLCGK